jgi:hypothetical protein
MPQRKKLLKAFGFITLALLAAIALSACKEKAEAPARSEVVSLATVSAVMGRASGANSGVSELTETNEGFTINYHLYLPEQKDFDALIGTDLAPKIQELYKTFKTIDKVTFTVETGVTANPPSLQPYCSFEMTRKIYNQTNWTNLLARDLFKVCRVNYAR